MYLKRTPTKSGKTSLSIVKGFRDGSGRVRQRTIKTLGFLEDLREDYEDPIAHFTQVARDMTEEERREHAAPSFSIHPAQKVDARSTNRKNVGCAAALRIYNSLGIEAALRNHTARSKSGYDINAVMRLVVVERLLHPCSKLSALSRKDSYFFRSSFGKDDLYRALDVLAQAKDKVVSAVNKGVEKNFGRDASHVFYDVTNYYFERDPDEGPEALVANGPCKEHRPSPIVQMGLLQDSDGIPMSYRLYRGNTPDCETMLPSLADMKRGLGVRGVTAVADKGLNCSKNMAALAASGDFFVFSQSIRGTKSSAEVRRRALDPAGYVEALDGGGGPVFKRKGWQGFKTVHLEAGDAAGGASRDVRIECKFVAFWSRKHERRARAQREKVLEKSRELVADPGEYSRATHYGAARYVRNVAFDKTTGEVVETGGAAELDLDSIARDEACDGYYLIVTNHTDWDDDRIIEAYRGLWQIEESFRITKSGIRARPVYVRTREHIEAHFLTCYVALVILRLLQKVCPSRPSAARIAEALSRLSCSALEGNWWLFDYRSELTEELFAATGLEHPTKYMQTKEIRSLMQKEKQPSRQG